MNKFHSIFNEIKKYMKYMIYDEYIVFSSNYVRCMNDILCVLKNTLSKLQIKSALLEPFFKFIKSCPIFYISTDHQ